VLTLMQYTSKCTLVKCAFCVHGSVHSESVSITVQQDATLYSFISCKLLYMFRVIPSPIIRSAIEPYATFHCRGVVRTAVLTAEGSIRFDQCQML
jgi:hypothetical protein